MSEGTTKPNGSREMKVEEFTEIEKIIRKAEYNFRLNWLEAYFSKEKIQDDTANSGSSANSAKPAKAGDHTLVPNKETIAFKPLIPFIAAGAKAKTKISKNRGKDGKTSSTQKDTQRKENTDQDRI